MQPRASASAGGLAELRDINLAVYAELRQIAARMMTRERDANSLGASVVTNEALIRTIVKAAVHADLCAQLRASLTGDRRMFRQFVALEMTRVLVDHARRRRLKWERQVPLADIDPHAGEAEFGTIDLIALEDAFDAVALDDRDRELVRLWGSGYPFGEIGEIFGMSEAWARVRFRAILSRLRSHFEVDLKPA